MLPYCGVKQRNNALSQGIKGWTNPKCNSSTLGFKPDSHHGRIVDSCLEANRGNKLFVVKPSTQHPNLLDLSKIPDKEKYYIDFEMVSNVCDDFSTMPAPSTMDLAFMLTVGYYNEKKRFVTKTFTAQGLTPEFEREMFVDAMKVINLKNATIIHWGHCDKNEWRKIERKYGLSYEPKMWFNAHQAVQNNALGINGCFNYSLKSVNNALYRKGLVNHEFTNNEHGLEAMHQAYVAHMESEGDVFINHHYIRTLKDYNVKDVIALKEVTKFLETLM